MTFSPFPFRLEAFAEKQDKSAIERKIKELKVQLQFLIQSNFPVLGATPFGDWTTRNYLDRHFSGEQMGQDWRKNMQIQHMLQELNQLEQDRKSLTQKSSAWKRMDEYTDKQIDAIDKHEDEADEDIDREHNGPGVPSFVGRYSHGIEEHRNKLKRQTRELREREKKEAKRSADTDTPESILRRMDKYADMGIDIAKRNEKEQDNRIRRDHRNPNVPKKVRKRNHDYDEHTDDLFDEIKKLQRQERQDVKRQLEKSQKMQKGVRVPAEYKYGDPRRFGAGSPAYPQPTVADPTVYEKHASDRFEAEERAKANEQKSLELSAGRMTSALAFKTSNNISDEDWDKLQSAIKNPSTIAEKRAAFEKIGGRHHSGYLSQQLNRHAMSNISKAQSVLSTPKVRISARDVDGEGHLSDAVESRMASSDQGRRAESRMARRSTMKPNNIREVNRRQIDRDISRPGSRANIAYGRKVKSDEQASGMKTKGDLPIPVPPDPYRGGQETRAQRHEVRDRSIAREESVYREGQARRQYRISRGADPEELDWDGSYHDDSELFKSKKKRKKKKWPSFDVQSHQIAKREGVSEKDADAMLASRGRNHGTRKSLSEMSLAEIYKATQGNRRTKPLAKVFDPSIFSEAANFVPDADDIGKFRDLKHGVHYALGSVSAALARKRDAVNKENQFKLISNHPNRRPQKQTGMPPGLGFAQGAVETAAKWTKPESISGPVINGINNLRQRIGF